LIDATTDPKTGLFSRFNCRFIGDSIDRVFDAMCVNYVSPSFKVIVAVAISSVCIFFATFFTFTLAIRYARKVRKMPVKPKGNAKGGAAAAKGGAAGAGAKGGAAKGGPAKGGPAKGGPAKGGAANAGAKKPAA